jgi:alpha-mannosidase
MEFNHPLVVRKSAPHGGILPKRWGLLDISPANVVLTALKPGRDRTAVFRVFEAAGQGASGVRVRFNARIAAARDANLMEDSGRRLRVRDDTIEFDLHPFEIKTFKLQLRPARAGTY